MPVWLRIMVACAIVVGVFLRSAFLDRKVYTFDETYTSLRVSGHTRAESKAFYYRSSHTIEDLLVYQSVNRLKGTTDTVRSLAIEDPQHPPLYYVLERGWVELFGNSIQARRGLSALASILALPAIFWLCLELFGAARVGWVAAALLAVSPFQILYAQQAREYSLWTLFTLVGSALLLRALRLKAAELWLAYAVAIGLGLYCNLFFLNVLLAHAIYAAITIRAQRGFAAWGIASTCALISFAPWLSNFFGHWDRVMLTTSFGATSIPLKFLALKWAFNVGAVFFDLEHAFPMLSVIAAGILILIAVTFIFLVREATPREWLFILSLTAVSALALAIPDLLLKQAHSTAARYLVPTWIGVELAMAYLFASRLRPRQPTNDCVVWGAGLAALLAVCAVSSAIGARANFWWINVFESPLQPIARILNAVSHPLVVSQDDLTALQLSNELLPRAEGPIFAPDLPRSAESLRAYGVIYLVRPDRELRRHIALDHRLKLEPVPITFWTGSSEVRQLRAVVSAARTKASSDQPKWFWKVTLQSSPTCLKRDQRAIKYHSRIFDGDLGLKDRVAACAKYVGMIRNTAEELSIPFARLAATGEIFFLTEMRK